jgi:hypothetical protein
MKSQELALEMGQMIYTIGQRSALNTSTSLYQIIHLRFLGLVHLTLLILSNIYVKRSLLLALSTSSSITSFS